MIRPGQQQAAVRIMDKSVLSEAGALCKALCYEAASICQAVLEVC